jgi:hypothetical protein
MLLTEGKGEARMAADGHVGVPPETVIHRIGGVNVENLRLKPREEALTPPGISVLLGGTPAQAAKQMRQAFPDPQKFARLHELANTVGTTTAAAIGQAGFGVMADPSAKFPQSRSDHPSRWGRRVLRR